MLAAVMTDLLLYMVMLSQWLDNLVKMVNFHSDLLISWTESLLQHLLLLATYLVLVMEQDLKKRKKDSKIKLKNLTCRGHNIEGSPSIHTYQFQHHCHQLNFLLLVNQREVS